MSRQTEGITKDIIKYITYFGSQNSYVEPTSIADNEFHRLVNMYHEGNKVRRRFPHKKFHNNIDSINLAPVGFGTFRQAASTYFVWGTIDGKAWRRNADGTNLGRILTGAGANPLNLGAKIDIKQYFNNLYIVDRNKLWHINTSTWVATDLTVRLTDYIPGFVPIRMAIWQNRLIVFGLGDQMLTSKQEANISGDATAFDYLTVGTTAFYTPVAIGNGAVITGTAVGNKTLVINKSLARDFVNSTYTVTGTSQLDFKLEEISSSISYLGASGISVGSKILGLTQSRFEYLSTIESKGTSSTTGVQDNIVSASNFDSGLIPDFVKDILREINIDYSDLCVGIYNPLEEAYYCSIPYGWTTFNNLTIRIDLTNNQTRMSLFTNTNAQYFAWANGHVYFIDEYSNIWKMMSRNETSYDEGKFTAFVVTRSFPVADGTVNGTILEFTPSIRTFKPQQNMFMYFETMETAVKSGAVIKNTSRQGINPEGSKSICNEAYSFYPVRYDKAIYNENEYDNNVFRQFNKAIPVNTMGDFGALVIVDDSNDTDGKGTWQLENIKIKIRPEKEAV